MYISVDACLIVRLSVCLSERISAELCPIFIKFLLVLPEPMARCFSGGVTRYILPVLRTVLPRQSIRELTQHGAARNRGGVRILENWGGLYDEILGAPLFKRNV